MKIFNIFAKKKINNTVYQCLLLRTGVIGIVDKSVREESLEMFGVDMFSNEPRLFCELMLKDLPIKKMEKNTLKQTKCLYFYESQNNMVSDYQELLTKLKDEENRNIKKEK